MQACRTCLNILHDDTEYYSVDNDNLLISKLLTCVPELALDVVQCPVICRNCIEVLNIAFNFKNQCLQTEEKIMLYVHCNNVNSLNIIDLVQLESPEQVQHAPLEHVFLEDVKPELSDETNSFLHPQVTIDESTTFDHKPPVPYSPDFDIKVIKSETDNRSVNVTVIKPFKCTFCEKGFVRKDKLLVHTRMHTGEKPFQCTFCERSFSRKDKMNNHLRTHTKEKPFACVFCMKAFSRKDKLNSHMRSQHYQITNNLEISIVKPPI